MTRERRQQGRGARRRLWLALPALLVGCAGYQPLPLQTTAGLLDRVDQLRTDASRHAELPDRWRLGVVKVADGLDEDAIIKLAVLNNPHLAALQTTLQQAAAKLVQAGLLPDPQLLLSADVPPGNTPATVTAYGLGLGFDLQALITRSARKDAATKQARSRYLQVLWQEWQVIGKARMLYRRALMQQQQLELTAAQQRQTTRNWQLQHHALTKRNSTLDAEGLARAAMMDSEASRLDARRQYNTTIHQLALLLGLSPLATLPLVPPKAGIKALLVPPPPAAALRRQLGQLDGSRPDLLALQAGYRAQEARVRQQILAQFPSFTLGANRLRDTGGIWTLGPFVQLNLPLWNGNRGQIALARATRNRLRAEYRDRLTAAQSESERLVADQRLAWDALATLQRQLPALDRLMQRMRKALAGGNVSMLTYTTLQGRYFAQRMKRLLLMQTVMEQAVALDTVLGRLPVTTGGTE